MCGGQLLVVREDREWVTARSRHRQKAESDGMIQYDTEGQVQPQELLGFYNTTLWEEKEKEKLSTKFFDYFNDSKGIQQVGEI